MNNARKFIEPVYLLICFDKSTRLKLLSHLCIHITNLQKKAMILHVLSSGAQCVASSYREFSVSC